MDLKAYFDAEFDDHAATLSATRSALGGPFADLVAACRQSLDGGGKILIFGNGGSAADAQHIATELTVRYEKSRPAIAAIALTTDTSTLTAAANDLGFDHVYARQIEALGRPGDVAIGISTSGTSANVINALNAAKTGALVAAGLSGRDGGDMVGICDPLIVVPSERTARIQEMHILIGHMLCGALEAD